MFCRLCLAETINYLLIFGGQNEGVVADSKIAKLIKKFFRLELLEKNLFSNVICNDCWRQLDGFHAFWLSIEEKQIALRQRITATSDEIDLLQIKVENESVLVGNETIAEEQELRKAQDDELEQSLCGPEFESNAVVQAFTISKFEATPFELSALALPVKTELADLQNDFIAEERNVNVGDDSMLIENTLMNGMVDTPLSFERGKSSISTNNSSGTYGNDNDNRVHTSDNLEKASMVETWMKNANTKKGNVDHEYETDANIVENEKLTCFFCSEPQENFTILKCHFRDKHNCGGYAVCCNKTFYKSWEYFSHLKLHEDPEYFKCTQCSKVCANSRSLRNHMNVVHSSAKDLKFPCSECDRKFSKQYLLNRHVRDSHNVATKDENTAKSVAKLTCCICSEPQENFTRLISHFRDNHNCKGYAVCCNKSFYKPGAYNDHIKWHKDPGFFKCTQCSKVFASTGSLRMHTVLIHPSAKDMKFQCTKCDRKFSKQYLLARHCRATHKVKNYANDNNDKANADADLSKNAELTCCLCSKPLETFARLKYHFRDQHNCAGYAVCCNKSFYTRREYYDHIKLHKEPDCLTCTLCNKVFKCRESMKRHMFLIHSSAKDLKFSCTKCGRKFCKQYLLNAHVRDIHERKSGGNDNNDKAEKN